MPDSPMQQMLADPGFDKLPEPQKYDNVIAGLERSDPSFLKRDPKFKMGVATEILGRAGKLHPKPMQGGGAAIQKPLPGAVEFGENYVAPAVGAVTGAAAGGAVGGPAGAAVGSGLGQAAADVGSAYINKKFFGRNPDLSLRHVASEEAVNATIGAIGEAIPVGAILKGTVGATPLIEGAKQAETQATGAVERFGESRAASAGAAREAAVKARGQTAEALAPEARGQAIQQQLGRTAQQGAAARAMPAEQAGQAAIPGSSAVERQDNWTSAVFNPIHRASQELGNQYERLFGAVKNKALPNTEGLTSSVDNIRQFESQTGYTPGPQVLKLLRTADLMGKKIDVNKILAGKGGSKGAINLSNEEWDAMNRAIEGGEGAGNATINSLLTLRSQALDVTRSAANARDKSLAFQVIEGTDNTLEASGLVDQDALKAINRRYGSYRRTFDTAFRRKVAGEFEPTDVAGDIFTSPQRIEQIWAGANDEEKGTLRQTYADWVLKNGVDKAPGILKQEDQKIVLQKLYPNTPLADPKNWIHLDDKLVTAENVINTSPQLRQEFRDQMTTRFNQIVNDRASEAVQWAQKEAKNLGPYGEVMTREARKAKTPQDGAKIVMDFMRTHAQDAPVQALIHGEVGGKPIEGKAGMFVSRAKRGLAWYPEILAATWMMGHPSTFAAAGLGAAGVAGLHVGLQRGLKNALKNPETAQAFWRAVNDSDSFARTRALGRMTSDALMAEATAGLERKLGTSLKQQGEDMPPMVIEKPYRPSPR